MAPDINQLIKRTNFNSSELIDLLASHDTLIKKFTCDYLADKSSIDSNLSLLTANILLRDCSDANPAIRASSLLALSSLPNMEDASISSVAKSLTDPAPQVRRAACFCCVSLYKHAPESFLRSGLVDLLYDGIKDSDPLAIVNCLLALEDVLEGEGGLIINKGIAHHLLGRLSQFSAEDSAYVLNILIKYEPKKEEELFGMLNDLDFCLKSSAPSVLAAAIHYFFHLTKDYPHLSADLYDVIHVPLCKILSQSRPELCYFMLSFVQTLSNDFKKSFSGEFKYFLVKSKDPAYLREKKFEVLPQFATKENISEIISEVKHYVSDFQSYKNAFRCLGVLGSLNSQIEAELLNILAPVIKNSNDQVVDAALECVLTVLHKKKPPSDGFSSVPVLLIQSVSMAISRTSLQEHNPELVLRTFELLVPLLNNVQDFLEDFSKQVDALHVNVRRLFLTCTCIAFLHCPSVVHPVLSSVLRKALKSENNDLSSHAAFIYAALEEGPAVAYNLLSISKLFQPEFIFGIE